ncbi:ComEC/Rec2 family competence protein [Micromonospora sp. WMMD1102]|uniref:ComEC/Rec2 family competence protein n=1 Tax=Micromonospora sp. WMMD1102 TaxID=3016105 RepID=UPI002414F615|nr:ComEC/Rec2 family competence protein [Micromonospora sp. WMMD1102]MDG4789268.1 ComEC/Rec2 family competence protein [Micromonospora sp. WMMD1102]
MTAGGGAAGDGDRRRPDLRLAGLAVGAWLSALAGLLLGTGPTVLVAVLAGVAALVTSGWLTVSSRPDGSSPRIGSDRVAVPGRVAVSARLAGGTRVVFDRHGWVVVTVLLGVVCGSVATAARLAVRDAEPVSQLAEARARVSAELVIREDPRPIGGAAGLPTTYLLPARLVWVAEEERPRVRVPARILVLATEPGWRRLLPGQRVTASGRLAAPRGGDLTAAVLTVDIAPELRGTPSWAQRVAGSLRAGLQRACAPLPAEPGGLLPGLVVGDTSRLETTVEEDFLATGMTHLTAVSGSNVAIVVGMVLLLARWARAGPWLAAVLCGIALVGFVVLARPSPSVVRAGTMGAIGLLGLALGRPRAALPALAGAVTVLVVVDPDLAGDPGFALSVLATGGLLLLAPRWRDGLRRRGVPPGAAEALAVPAAAQLACAPVVAGLSGTISLVAIPANLLAVPAVAPATMLGVTAAVLSPLWPDGAQGVAWLGGWPAWWLVLVARYGARLPAGTVPWLDGVVGGLLLGALTVALLIAVRRPPVRRIVAVVTTAVVVGALPVRVVASGWPPVGWVVVACAVGQGDSLVLPLGAGRAVVVDAGADPTAVDRCLRRLGVRTVALLLVSHFHADHVDGVDGVFRGRRVEAVIAPRWLEPVEGRGTVERAGRMRGVPVGVAGPGWTYTAGPVTLTLLGPPYPIRGTRSDPNNNSLVLRAEVGGVSILLTGDAETEEQQALLELLPVARLRADVLKVAHHGSAYQEPAFLDAVRPAVALVPVGVDNGYGHPNAGVLARLSRSGARVLRTDQHGDLAVLGSGGEGLAVAVRGLDPGDPATR